MLLEAVGAYMADLGEHRQPLIEYTLIRGINDHRRHARELAALVKEFPCKINLIPFNEFGEVDYQRPSASSIGNFRKILQDAGLVVTIRTTRADEIAAACGQLTGAVRDQTRRRQRLLRKTKGEARFGEEAAALIHSTKDDSWQRTESRGSGR